MRKLIRGAGTPDADQAPCTRLHRTDADVPSQDNQFFLVNAVSGAVAGHWHHDTDWLSV